MKKRKRNIFEASQSIVGQWLSIVRSSGSKKHKPSDQVISVKGPSIWNSFYSSAEPPPNYRKKESTPSSTASTNTSTPTSHQNSSDSSVEEHHHSGDTSAFPTSNAKGVLFPDRPRVHTKTHPVHRSARKRPVRTPADIHQKPSAQTGPPRAVIYLRDTKSVKPAQSYRHYTEYVALASTAETSPQLPLSGTHELAEAASTRSPITSLKPPPATTKRLPIAVKVTRANPHCSTAAAAVSVVEPKRGEPGTTKKTPILGRSKKSIALATGSLDAQLAGKRQPPMINRNKKAKARAEARDRVTISFSCHQGCKGKKTSFSCHQGLEGKKTSSPSHQGSEGQKTSSSSHQGFKGKKKVQTVDEISLLLSLKDIDVTECKTVNTSDDEDDDEVEFIRIIRPSGPQPDTIGSLFPAKVEATRQSLSTSASSSTSSSTSSDDSSEEEYEPTEYYSTREFKRMWKNAERDFGLSTEEIEEGNLVRGANTKMNADDSMVQSKAQYGRILPGATDYIFRELMKLEESDVFVDIGHGIGNTLLQASYTYGCESRGIEVVKTRNYLAEQFKANLEAQYRNHNDHPPAKIGKVFFNHGRLEQPKFREFLTECNKSNGVIKALANNFNGVFADRCAKVNQNYFLDHYISGLFTMMKPGSILITLHPLLDLPPSLSTITENRRRHKLTTCNTASFYELEQFSIGKAKDSVSWSHGGGNKKNVIVYRYTRVQQPTNKAVFLCNNPKCSLAESETPIPATKLVDIEGEERVVVNHCKCNISEKSLRQRRKIDYTHYGY